MILRGNSHIPLERHQHDDRSPYCRPATVFGDALTDASPDLMRYLLQTMINALLSADAVVGAECGERSPDRTTHRQESGRESTSRAGAVRETSTELLTQVRRLAPDPSQCTWQNPRSVLPT